MSTDIIVRKSLSEDLKYLSKTVKDLVEHTRISSQDAYFLELDQGYELGFDEFVSAFIQDGSSLCLISEVEGSYAGSLIAKEAAPFLPFSKIKRIGEIVMCWVEPEFRNRGIAKALVNEAESWLKGRGIEHIELNFIVGNSEAEAVWERLGYKPFRINSRKTLDL